MSNVFNLLGGSGGLKPQIIVTAPTGSTVTLDGITGTEVSGTWTFNTSLGTHTIVATLGTKTKTETVLVDDVARYEVEITYLPSNCLAEYLFENQNFNDTSGNGYDGTLGSATFTSGIIGNYAITKSVATPNTTVPQALFTLPLSISTWVTLPQSNSSDASIFYFYVNDFYIQIEIRPAYNSGNLTLFTETGNYQIAPFVAGAKHHIVVTVSTGKLESCYVDNVNVVTNANVSFSVSARTQLLSNERSRAWTGKLDNLRFYNRILTTDEISQLYAEGV